MMARFFIAAAALMVLAGSARAEGQVPAVNPFQAELDRRTQAPNQEARKTCQDRLNWFPSLQGLLPMTRDQWGHVLELCVFTYKTAYSEGEGVGWRRGYASCLDHGRRPAPGDLQARETEDCIPPPPPGFVVDHPKPWELNWCRP